MKRFEFGRPTLSVSYALVFWGRCGRGVRFGLLVMEKEGGVNFSLVGRPTLAVSNALSIENRIYREELKESLGMNFFSPFRPEREFKV